MAKLFLLLYPSLLIILSLVFRKTYFSKLSRLTISLFIIIVTSFISSEIVLTVKPGDYAVYTKIFDLCRNINQCISYSPFEDGFSIFIGFITNYLKLNGHGIWLIINIINLSLITYISLYISRIFNNDKLFLSTQALIIAFTLPSFILVSIRAGLAFLICSISILNVLSYEKYLNKVYFVFANLVLLILAISIHFQSAPLILFTFVLFFYIKNNIKVEPLYFDFINNLFQGLISKKILSFITLIILFAISLFYNFTKLFSLIGKSYYYLNPLGASKSLGIRTITDQLLISGYILPALKKSNIYINNLNLFNFINLFSIFQLLTFFLYYITNFLLGIDGLARQCQYNFLVFLLFCLVTFKRTNLINLIPFIYSLILIYYTILRDRSFAEFF